MNKQMEWVDQSFKKIGKNNIANMSFSNSEKSIDIVQNAENKGFQVFSFSKAEKNPVIETVPDKETLFHVEEAHGLPAEKLVEREKDLGDFREPVVMHTQSTKEKELIMHTVKDMKPGDELTYFLPDRRSDDREFVDKGFHVKLVCVEKDKLQYLFVNSDDGQTEKGVPIARQVKASELLQQNRDGNFSLNHRPDGLVFRPTETYQLSDIQDIHIAKGKFNKSEIEAISSGASVDYNQVCARQPIKNEKAYITYVLKKNRPDFTHGEDKAIGTMNQEWNFGVTSKFLGKKENLSKEALAAIQEADSSKKKKVYFAELDKLDKAERKRLMDHRFATGVALSDAGNTDRMDAVITLSRATKDFSNREIEWQKLSEQCRQIADQLPQGEKLDVIASISKKDEKTAQRLDVLVDELKKLYPNIDKGLEKVSEKRTETAMENFYKEQQQKLAEKVQKQKETGSAKKVVVKKSKSKTAGRSQGR